MWCRLIIDGNAVYEIDEECLKKKQGKSGDKNSTNSGKSKESDK